MAYRRAVVALQCCWRRKLARRELRARRQEAREAGKLLKDKAALDEKLKETLAILETVQNQRNELRQLYKVRPLRLSGCLKIATTTVLLHSNEKPHLLQSRKCSGNGLPASCMPRFVLRAESKILVCRKRRQLERLPRQNRQSCCRAIKQL